MLSQLFEERICVDRTGHWVPLMGWFVLEDRDEQRVRLTPTLGRGYWSDGMVDDTRLAPAGVGLGDQETVAKIPKSLWLCILHGRSGT